MTKCLTSKYAIGNSYSTTNPVRAYASKWPSKCRTRGRFVFVFFLFFAWTFLFYPASKLFASLSVTLEVEFIKEWIFMYIHWHKMPAKWLNLNIFGKICQPVLDGDPAGRFSLTAIHDTVRYCTTRPVLLRWRGTVQYIHYCVKPSTALLTWTFIHSLLCSGSVLKRQPPLFLLQVANKCYVSVRRTGKTGQKQL